MKSTFWKFHLFYFTKAPFAKAPFAKVHSRRSAFRESAFRESAFRESALSQKRLSRKRLSRKRLSRKRLSRKRLATARASLKIQVQFREVSIRNCLASSERAWPPRVKRPRAGDRFTFSSCVVRSRTCSTNPASSASTCSARRASRAASKAIMWSCRSRSAGTATAGATGTSPHIVYTVCYTVF